jgi:hypothetical protein
LPEKCPKKQIFKATNTSWDCSQILKNEKKICQDMF